MKNAFTNILAGAKNIVVASTKGVTKKALAAELTNTRIAMAATTAAAIGITAIAVAEKIKHNNDIKASQSDMMSQLQKHSLKEWEFLNELSQ